MEPLDKDFRSLGDVLENSVLNRRQLLKRSAIFGLSVPAIGTLLAACGSDDEEEPEEEDAAAESTAEGPPAFEEEPTEEPAEEEPTEEPAEEEPTEEPAEEEPTEEPAEDEATEEPAGEMGGPGDGVRGGTLRVTMSGDLGTFDTQAVTQSVVGYVVWHIWEHLFTYDAEMNIVPELADTYEVSEDGLTHTIGLREAMFHNGNPMTAEDVAASIERWRQIAGTAGDLADISDTLTAVDDRTVEWKLTQPFGILDTVLARQNAGCVIFPKEIMEKLGTEPLTEYEDFIGTGTYQFVEHQPDRHIHLRRFEDYVSRQEPSSGYAGYKNQYVDEIFFIPVTEETASVAGLRAGDYQYVDSLSPVQHEPLASDANVKVEFIPSATWGAFVFNCEDANVGGYDNKGMGIRQAILQTIDMEQVALGYYGEGWYRMHPSISFEGLPWETEAGGEFYNQADPEGAQAKLEEIGYAGETVLWMTDREEPGHYETSVLAMQQLEDNGITMEMELYDWATIGERRLEHEGWSMMTTAHTFRVDPIQLSGIGSATTYGFWGSDEIEALRTDFTSVSGFENRFPVWEEIQTLFYHQVPKMKVADQRSYHAMSVNLQGWDPTVQVQAKFWNVWLEQ